MTEKTALVPVETRTVDFYGDNLIAALVQIEQQGELQIYIPLRPVCEFLGLSWGSQRNRLYRDEVLRGAVQGVFITNTPQEGGTQEMVCLPLTLLPGWLFGISATRVKGELREKITRYRAECFQVLWNTFKFDILPGAEISRAPGQSPAQLAYELATAVQHIACQQLEHEQRLAQAARWAAGVERRLTTLEMQVGEQALIDDGQAADLAIAVRNIGQALEAQGKGSYQTVYGDLYRRYRVTSYKSIPHDQYEQVMTWLHQWFATLTGTTGQQ